MAFACYCLLFAACGMAVAADGASPAALVDAGHYKRARAILEPRVQANPNDAEAAYLLSAVREAFQDFEGALKLASKAAGLDPNNAKCRYQLAQVYGGMAVHAGVFRQMSLSRDFLKEALDAAALDPSYIDARMGLIEFYLLAPALLGGGNDKAQKTAAEIALIDPAQGYIAQAPLADESKDIKGEESAYRKAVAANPHNVQSWVGLANVLIQKENKYDEGERTACEAIRIDPGRTGGFISLSVLYAMQNRWSDLDAELAQARDSNPDDLSPYYQAGKTILVRGGDPVRAEGYFRKYLTQEPEGGTPSLAAAHRRLALVLAKGGRKPEAVRELQTALKLQPDFPEARDELARIK